MSDTILSEQFDEHRRRLHAVAYRMLGSTTDAEDAVQETWLRLNRSDAAAIENLGAWLTTVTARVCLNMLRSRRSHREEPILDNHVPDPVVQRADVIEPEREAELADSVGLALLVVLETLEPAERLAFVLHDMFAVPFDEIAGMLERSPEAARQLASRARRRVQGASVPDTDRALQRRVVDAFLAAARGGDFDALVSVLHPDVVVRSDGGPRRRSANAVTHGAAEVAARALTFRRQDAEVYPAIVNGAAGIVSFARGKPISIMDFTVSGGKVVAIDILADPDRLARLDLSAIAG